MEKITLTCTISKEPGCLSLCMMVPTRPVLRPPVTMHKFPASNLMESMILPVLMSNLKNIREKQISFKILKFFVKALNTFQISDSVLTT